MKSLKWEGIGTKNLFPHTSTFNVTLSFRDNFSDMPQRVSTLSVRQMIAERGQLQHATDTHP